MRWKELLKLFLFYNFPNFKEEKIIKQTPVVKYMSGEVAQYCLGAKFNKFQSCFVDICSSDASPQLGRLGTNVSVPAVLFLNEKHNPESLL